ncbi:23S rRNA (pseudouridine(1915)-N(3))-methyltransferase RlmH [Campylobacter sp. 19-13652]|uniref:23S rRNA (pseudouridine(1915)-N(3))-methyltransferase RlmH n=1 Tax=Campylobacter sp. 19-13652 TaxID=2840180 RepID=UPI001C849819|nr:23S rRNA (pseudouridine(1915)-N(3))-methyltransferase RlmH [Campylobacter sp. 19-13652]
MQIVVHSIQKGASEYENELASYAKMSARYAKISECVIFNDRIAKAQSQSRQSALKSYDEVYLPKLSKGFNIALDERGKMLSSEEFAALLDAKQSIGFFIGGAYGLSDGFKNSCDVTLSLSALTMAHKIAKLVLFEQIYRALAINAGHPYHK